MSEDIKAAPVNWELLSAGLNYWGEMKVDRSEDGIVLRDADSPIVVRNRGDQRHALAALCLYQQPFGFTAADLSNLQTVEDELWRHNSGPHMEATADVLQHLRARIAALLPPERT